MRLALVAAMVLAAAVAAVSVVPPVHAESTKLRGTEAGTAQACVVSATNHLTLRVRRGPTVSGVAPRQGPQAGGTSVTITGSGFTGATAVAFGSVAATAFNVDSDTQVTATSPGGCQTVDVIVTTRRGSSSAVTSDRFTYVAPSPIRHVVVIYQENHSFDNLLGAWCDQTGKCLGVPASITLKDGAVVTPAQAPTTVPQVSHSVASQQTAIDGGVMDGWDQVSGCQATVSLTGAIPHGCMSYYAPSQVPNLTRLAGSFAISDMTFSEADSPSWGGHLYAVAATTDGFLGNNPVPNAAGPGWGCDSNKHSAWLNPSTLTVQNEPSCVPDPSLGIPNGGADTPTPVSYVRTIMDRLDTAGLPWKIYATNVGSVTMPTNAYIWATCPSFAECLDTSQRQNLVPTDQILTDAGAGTLPAFSLVLPGGAQKLGEGGSQHNGNSITVGDNWIGTLTTALEASPDWSSTAIFITYDDCGCFYDQVPPGLNPDGSQEGVRVPLVIVSPYAVAGYVDTTPTTFAGILAFAEQTFGLALLNVNDAGVYPFTNAFNYSQPPLAPVRMIQERVPASAYLLGAGDAEDPT